MKRIMIQNEFTQWAEYLARYFGRELAIYDCKGDLMWGSEEDDKHLTKKQLRDRVTVYPIVKGIGEEPVAFYDGSSLTLSERHILDIIIPFIESQLDDEGA